MANMKLTDQNGKEAGQIALNDDVFAIKPNDSVVFEAVLRQRAGKRQGTSAVKNRSAVRGGGKKPWRQKGTGRARQGSIRAPQWRGGGTVFGPTPRSYAFDMNRKARRLAMKSVLSQKVADKELTLVDKFNLAAPKTKDFVAVLNNLKLSGKILIVSDDENVQLSARNLPKVKVVPVNGLNIVDAVNYDQLVLTQDAVKRIEEVLA